MKFFVRVAAVAALAFATLVPAGTAASAAPPASWHTTFYTFMWKSSCVANGESGLERGLWTDYLCFPRPVGIEFGWGLSVYY